MENMRIVPAGKKGVEAQYVEMMVPLYSYGCEKKVKKALANFRGTYSVSVNYMQQKVTVWGICNKHDVLATIRSKRKGARFWDAEDSNNNNNNNNVVDSSEESPPPSTTAPIKLPRSLTVARSLSWKAWKKAFVTSYSF